MGPLQYHTLRQRLRHLLNPDPNTGPGGEYRITSLYFDDAEDSALFTKLAGSDHRAKIRLRTYNGDCGKVFLERKIKQGEGIHKDRLSVTSSQYDALIRGDADALRNVTPGDEPPGDETPQEDQLLTDVAWQVKHRLLRPKVIVDYVREAYVHPLGNVRITFDKSLRSGLTCLDLRRDAPYVPVPLDGQSILEVKYDAFLPRAVQDVLQGEVLVRQSASKYVLCRTLCKFNPWEAE